MHSFDDLLLLSQIAHSDPARSERTGIPEIILAERKTIPQCLTIAAEMVEREGRALISRVSPELLAALHNRFPNQAETGMSGATVVLRRNPHDHPAQTGGRVGVLTAGTSDIPIAEEAALVCRELGCTVQSAYDVGIAGLHRLIEPLRTMVQDTPVDVLIVAAGMDGALPAVVAGLVDMPVIGLPTSVGYGMGGGGVAALLGMLQSCSPGLAVVNIDNGIGAGALAVRIAKSKQRARG
jgi:hypothetical protein